MCKEIENNERRLVTLIDQLGTFTEEDLAREFFKGNKSTILTPFWDIKRYLEDFRELGSLIYINGHYSTGMRQVSKSK